MTRVDLQALFEIFDGALRAPALVAAEKGHKIAGLVLHIALVDDAGDVHVATNTWKNEGVVNMTFDQLREAIVDAVRGEGIEGNVAAPRSAS